MFHQRQILPLAATLCVTVIAGCGGGTGSSIPSTLPASAGLPTPGPISVPVAKPTPATTTAPAAAPLATAQLAGAAGFVNGQSQTVYVFDADLSAPGTSTCSGQCATVWPSVAATAKTAFPVPFSAIKRSDGTLQLVYAGRPLYTYIADSAAGSIAGDGITSFGATWHIARPAGVNASSPPNPAASTTPAPVN